MAKLIDPLLTQNVPNKPQGGIIDIKASNLRFSADSANAWGIKRIVDGAKKAAKAAARRGDYSVNLTIKHSRWLKDAVVQLRGEGFTVAVTNGRKEIGDDFSLKGANVHGEVKLFVGF